MTSLGLGDIARFPFVEPPDQRNITRRRRAARGARRAAPRVDGAARPTSGKRAPAGSPSSGRRLARLPIDPRLGRMILEAERLGCVREVIVIAAALSLQDPRERPAEQQAQADQQHARFKDETSDFLTWLNLWRYIKQQQRELSSSAFRRMCKREFLNYLRVREWQDFESQLRQVCKEMKIGRGRRRSRRLDRRPRRRRHPPGAAVGPALATSAPSRSGSGPGRASGARCGSTSGARGARFAVFPGSVLKGGNPEFLMAGELVETSRLWARQNAAIKPEWAERLGAHLVKRSYCEPHWSKKRAAVMAYEKVTLYGVPLVADRLVTYGKVDPALARELFIRHALVYGEWRTRHRFYARQPRAARGGRGARAPGAAPRHRGRRAHPLRLLRRPGGRRRGQRRPLRPVVEAERQTRPDLLTFDLECWSTTAPRRSRHADFPTQWHYRPA